MQRPRAPLLRDKQLYRLVHYAVDLTITGPSAYIDLRELQGGKLAFHMIITDQVLMNFYRSRPEEAKPLLIEYARHMAMEYLKLHSDWFNLQINEDTIVVRMVELTDNTRQFQVIQ